MPDWQSPEELQRDVIVHSKFNHALLGLYAFEWFISLDFEWDFITGKKRFRWPMIFYFANRYLMLATMIGVAITLDATGEIDCDAIYTFLQLAGDASVGLASVNLAIRTMAIWSQNRYVIGFLVLIILGHWSLILQSPTQLTAKWVPGVGCNIHEDNHTIFAAIFIYSMCLDLIVLLLTGYKVFFSRWKSQPVERVNQGRLTLIGRLTHMSRLTQMVFSDGLIYFLIAFLANLVATTFILLSLNTIMGVIFNAPAAIFSTIAACRAVRRLTNFAYDGPQIMSNSSRGFIQNSSNYKPSARPGVHVQMETFTHQEDQTYNDIFLKSKSGKDTDIQPDVEAKGTF